MTDAYSTCVALLHDVAEDTDVTLQYLQQIFPREVTDAVALLTHAHGTDYIAYITAIRENPIARTVKLADLRHNTDLTRMPSDPSAAQRWEEKYKYAFEILRR